MRNIGDAGDSGNTSTSSAPVEARMAAYLQQRQDRMAKLRANVTAEQDRELTFRCVFQST
jgi:hypothetical protein